MATLYASGVNWNTATDWGQTSGASDGWVPTDADDVIFNASSQSMTSTAAGTCKSLTTTSAFASNFNPNYALVVKGDVSLDGNGSPLIQFAADVTVDGNFSVASVQICTIYTTLYVKGNVAGSIDTYTWSAAISLIGSSDTTFDATSTFNLNINKSSATAKVTLTDDQAIEDGGIVYIQAGKLNLDGYDLTSGGTPTSISVEGTLMLQGDETLAIAPTFSAGATAEFSGVNAVVWIVCPNWSYKNIKINDVVLANCAYKFGEAHDEIESFTMTAGAWGNYTQITVSVGLYVNGGVFTVYGSSTVYIDGADFTITSGTFTANTGVVRFTSVVGGTSTLTLNGQSVYQLIFDSGNTVTITGDVSVTQTLYWRSGTLNGGTLKPNGNVDGYDCSTVGTTALTMTGAANQTLTCTSGSYNLFAGGTFTIDKSSGTVTLITDVVVNKSGQLLNLTSGTLYLAGFNLTVNSTFTVSSGANLQLKGTEATVSTPTLNSGSTVIYVGDNVEETKTCKNWAYKNLTFNDANGNLTTFKFGETHTSIEQFTMTAGIFSQAAGDYTITCTIFNLTGGTFTGGSAALTCNGNYSVATGVFTSTSGTLTITGNFSHSSGTWTHNNGTVALTGAGQSITGSTNFYTLTKNSPSDTLSFSAGHTFAFASSLSLQGSAGNKLNIRSLTPGTSYLMTFPATRTLKNLDFADVENSSAANPVYAGECSRSGKTYGVIFPGAW